MARKFPPKAREALKNYVYRLIDPRNGETFYVGRGKGDRVFDHVNDSINISKIATNESKKDELSEKLATIREIRLAGLEVTHIIHRHGMNNSQARQVEAALIDVYPGLTNQMRGHDADNGPANAQLLIEKYSAAAIKFDTSHRLLIVKVNQATVNDRGSLYEAARYAWRLKKERAERADFVLASLSGLCKGVFVPVSWHEMHEKRFGFKGFNKAPDNVVKRYLDKTFTDKGAKTTNPIRYINC